jgi:hypothetical protein
LASIRLPETRLPNLPAPSIPLPEIRLPNLPLAKSTSRIQRMQPTNHSPDDGPLPDLPPPLLIVDWGIEPQAGNHLSPEFHLVAPGYRNRPRVIAVLDRFWTKATGRRIRG